MHTIPTPIYGTIRALTQHGNRLLIATVHPEGETSPIFSFDVQTALEKVKGLGHVQSISTTAAVLGFVHHGANTLAITKDGLFTIQDDVLSEFVASSFPLQGACSLDEHTLLLVGSQSVALYDGTTTDLFSFDQEITAWASQKGGKRFALGLADGSLVPCFRKDSMGDFIEGVFFNEEDEEWSQVHAVKVTQLLYVETETSRGMVESLISIDENNQTFHTSILEGKPLERPSHNHAKMITSIIDTSLDVDTVQYGGQPYFYTVCMDGIIQPWSRSYGKSKIKKEAFGSGINAGCVMRLTVKVKGQTRTNHPCILVATAESFAIYPLVNHVQADLKPEELSLLKDNGKVDKKAAIFHGGNAFVEEFTSEHPKEKEGLDVYSQWSLEYAVRKVASIIRHSENSGLITKAKEALFSYNHPRQIVEMRSLITSVYNRSIREEVYHALKPIDSSLHPYRNALRAHTELAKEAVVDLANLYRSNQKQEVLELLVSELRSSLPIAQEAFHQFLGENAVISGVEGILYGLRSSHSQIRQQTVAQLSLHGLLNAPQTVLALRPLLESNDDELRRHALHVSLLRVPDLAYLLRSSNRGMHNMMCDLELSAEEAETAKSQFDDGFDDARLSSTESAIRNHTALDAADLMFELSSCFQEDVAAIPTLVNAKLGDASALVILEGLIHSDNKEAARLAAIGLGYFAESENSAYNTLTEISMDDSTPTVVRETAIDGFMAAALKRGYDSKLREALDALLSASEGVVRLKAITEIQRLVGTILETALSVDARALYAELESLRQAVNDRSRRLKRQEEVFASIRRKDEPRKHLEAKRKRDDLQELTEVAQNKVSSKEREIQSQYGDINVQTTIDSLKDLLKKSLGDSDKRVAREAFLCILNNKFYDLHDAQAEPIETLRELISFQPNHTRTWAIEELGQRLAKSKQWVIDIIADKFRSSAGVEIFDQMLPYLPSKDSALQQLFFDAALDDQYPKLSVRALRVMFAYTGDWMATLFQRALGSEEKEIANVALSKEAMDSLKKSGLGADQILVALKSGKEDQINAALAYLKKDTELYSTGVVRELRDMLQAQKVNMSFLTGKAALDWAARSGNEQGYFFELFNISTDKQKLRVIQSVAPKTDVWVDSFYEEVITHSQREIVAKGAQQHFYRKEGQDKEAAKSYIYRLVESQVEVQKIAGLRIAVLRYNQYPFAQELFKNAMENAATRRLANLALSAKYDWAEEFLKSALEDDDHEVVQYAFSELYSMYQSKGGGEQFLKEAVKTNRSLRQKALQLAANSAWKIELALGLLDDGSAAQVTIVLKLLEISNLDQETLENLRGHTNKQASRWATNQLMERGLLVDLESLRDTLREPWPGRKREWAWKQRKLKALDIASQGHITDLYEDIKFVADKIGISRKNSLGSYANKSVWPTEDLRAPSLIAMGWTCPEDNFLELEQRFEGVPSKNILAEAEYRPDGCNEFSEHYQILNTVAAAKALSYVGNKKGLEWMIQIRQFMRNNGWWFQNPHGYGGQKRRDAEQEYRKTYNRNRKYSALISDQDILIAATALGESNPSALMSVIDTSNQLMDDIVFATGLRLGAVGGNVDHVLTSLVNNTNYRYALQSNQLIAKSYDRETLLRQAIDFLNKEERFPSDPFANAQRTGTSWFELDSLLLGFYSREVNVQDHPNKDVWEGLGQLFGGADAKLRARSGSLLYLYRNSGMDDSKLATEVSKYKLQQGAISKSDTTLKINGVQVDRSVAFERSFGGYVTLVRAAQYEQTGRNALRCLVQDAPEDRISQVFSVLRTYLNVPRSDIQQDAYGYMISLQSSVLSDRLSVQQLILFGVRNSNNTIKKMGFVVAWTQLEQAECKSLFQEYIQGSDQDAAALAYEINIHNTPIAEDQESQKERVQLLSFGISSYNSRVRSLAIQGAVQEYNRRKSVGLGTEDDILTLLLNTMNGPHTAVANEVAAKMAQGRIVESHTRLISLLDSDLPSNQRLAIDGLVALSMPRYHEETSTWTEHYDILAPFGLVRTALLLMNRADFDRGGEVDRDALFSGVNQLKDSAPSIADRLFALVEQGADDPEYPYAIQSILTLSRFTSISSPRPLNVAWNERTEDQVREENRAKIDEKIYARLLSTLYRLGHYQTVIKYNLFNRVISTRTNSVDSELVKFAKLKETGKTEVIIGRAVYTLCARLDNHDRLRNSQANKDATCALITEALGKAGKKKPLRQAQVKLACALGRAAYNADNRVLQFLRMVSESNEYNLGDREEAIVALGKQENISAVSALLNLVGFDPEVQPLAEHPLADLGRYWKTRLEKATFEALGHMVSSPHRDAIFALLTEKSKYGNYRTACYQGLPYFGAREEYKEALSDMFIQRLEEEQDNRSGQEETIKAYQHLAMIAPNTKQKLYTFLCSDQYDMSWLQTQSLFDDVYLLLKDIDSSGDFRKKLQVAIDTNGSTQYQEELYQYLTGLDSKVLLAYYLDNRSSFNVDTISKLEEQLSESSASDILRAYDDIVARMIREGKQTTDVSPFIESTLQKHKANLTDGEKDQIVHILQRLSDALSLALDHAYRNIKLSYNTQWAQTLSYDLCLLLENVDGLEWNEEQDANLESLLLPLVQSKGLSKSNFSTVFRSYMNRTNADHENMKKVYQEASTTTRTQIAEHVRASDALSNSLMSVAKDDLTSMQHIATSESSRVQNLCALAQEGSVVSIQMLVRLGKSQELFDVFKNVHEKQPLANKVISAMALLKSEEGEQTLSEIGTSFPGFSAQVERAKRYSLQLRTPYPRTV